MWKPSKKAFHLLLVATCLGATVGSNEASGNAKKQKVCIIGAGPSGLQAAKQLAVYPKEFEIVVFERQSEVGGVWHYTDSTDFDEHNLPIYSSMYKNLRIHFPKEMMIFPDYLNFSDPEGRSCVTHETLLSYLKNYTDHYNLHQYIQLNTFVEKVTPIVNGSDWHDTKYLIKTKNLNTNQVSETTCDAVIVCNGHFSVPFTPIIPGIETFPGNVIHSKYYRKPEKYKNQVIVILGASTSGRDLSYDLYEHAKKIYLSHNLEKIKDLPEKIKQVAGVVRVNGSELILKDNSSIKADAFIFCTGYNYSYPFLDETSNITIDDNHVAPLYKHLINIEQPKMSFIGVPSSINIFTTVYVQAKYVVSLLRGKVQLPSKSEMMLDTIVPEGKRKRHFHDLWSVQYNYYDELARLAGFEPIPRWYQEVDIKWNTVLHAATWNFKEYNIHRSENGTITIHKPSNL